MQNVYGAAIYQFLSSELTIVDTVLVAAGLNELKREEALLQWVSTKDFTIVGLYAKAPRYQAGIEKYQEFFSLQTPDGIFTELAVKEEFTDITAPRLLQIPIQGVDDGNNQLYLGGDFVNELPVGQVHTILDTSNSYTPIGQATVASAVYVGAQDATIITYEAVDLSAVVIGDISYFQKGESLIGIDALIKWYHKNGNVVKEKTYKQRFEKGEAAIHEFNRRQITVNQMISSSDGTAIQPFVKTIYDHYKSPYIDDYVDLGKAQAWKDAIDAEVDTVINAYLDIQIPFTDIEGSTTMKPIRDWIKDELYAGYK